MCLAQFSKIFAIHSCTYQHCVLVSLSWFTGRASEFYFCAVFVPSILVWHCDHVLFWVDFLRYKSCINFHLFIHWHIHDWLGSVLCLHKQGLLILVLCVWFVCVTCVCDLCDLCVTCVCELHVWFVFDSCVICVCDLCVYVWKGPLVYKKLRCLFSHGDESRRQKQVLWCLGQPSAITTSLDTTCFKLFCVKNNIVHTAKEMGRGRESESVCVRVCSVTFLYLSVIVRWS